MHLVGKVSSLPEAQGEQASVANALRLVAPLPALTTPAALREAVVVALRCTLLLSAQDLLPLLRRFIAEPLTEQDLQQCLKQHRVARYLDFVPYEVRPFLSTQTQQAPGVFLLQVLGLVPPGAKGRPKYLYVALDLASRWCFMQLHASRSARTVAHFLRDLTACSPMPVSRLFVRSEPRGRLTHHDDQSFQDSLQQHCREQGIVYQTVSFANPVEDELAWAEGIGLAELFQGLGGDVADPERIIERFLYVYHAQLPQRALNGQTPVQALASYAVTAEVRTPNASAAHEAVPEVAPLPVEVSVAVPAANDETAGAPPRRGERKGPRRLVLLAALAAAAGWYGHAWISDEQPMAIQTVSSQVLRPDYSDKRKLHSWRVRMVLPVRQSELVPLRERWQSHSLKLPAAAPVTDPPIAKAPQARRAPVHRQLSADAIAEPKQVNTTVLETLPAVQTPTAVPVKAEIEAPVKAKAEVPPPVLEKPIERELLQIPVVEPVSVETPTAGYVEITPVVSGPADKADRGYSEALEHYHAGRIEQAETSLWLALKQQPAHIEARTLAVQLMIEQGRLDKADELLTQGLEFAPNHYPFVQSLVHILASQGHEREALTRMEGARSAGQADAGFMEMLAWLYQRNNLHANAAVLYADLLAGQPKQAKWWLGLAISLEAQQDRMGAHDAYNFALAAGLDAGLSQYAQQRLQQMGR